MGKKILYFISDEDKTGIELALENTNDEITIILLQNAVYFAIKANKAVSEALDREMNVFACKEDIDIRGLTNLIFEKVKLCNYEELIDVILVNDSIINM